MTKKQKPKQQPSGRFEYYEFDVVTGALWKLALVIHTIMDKTEHVEIQETVAAALRGSGGSEEQIRFWVAASQRAYESIRQTSSQEAALNEQNSEEAAHDIQETNLL